MPFLKQKKAVGEGKNIIWGTIWGKSGVEIYKELVVASSRERSFDLNILFSNFTLQKASTGLHLAYMEASKFTSSMGVDSSTLL